MNEKKNTVVKKDGKWVDEICCGTCAHYDGNYCTENPRLRYYVEPWWTCHWMPKLKKEK